ncbi:DUF945 family protein [Candidatus Marithrix sp. Canyon 246]|uniref:DUF945 family protein n=1 Tax=Candidatus Marithrix sp. Canyon 246 TaxID=1827136 RepID=UPI000849EEC9|nr:DUF945 family protein [Candidatus Marithrix sp. Canyon 246]
MKKPLIIIITIIVLTGIIAIPYATGVVAEQKHSSYEDRIYSKLKIVPAEQTYQRNWFNSYAQASFKTDDNHNYLLTQDIDHGFYPIQKPVVHTIIQDLSNTKKPLLEMITTVQLNADTLTTIKIPARSIKNGKAELQWNTLEASIYMKRHLAGIDLNFNGSKIQLDTEKEQIIINNLKLATNLKPDESDLMQILGNLFIDDMKISGENLETVKLKNITFEGNNKNANEHISLAMKSNVQQLQVGTEIYNSNSVELSLSHWHIPSLNDMKNTLVELQQQNLPPEMLKNVAMFRLMPYGIKLLNNTPKITVNNFNMNTAEGNVNGNLEVKMEPFEASIFGLLNNPSILIKALNAKLELLAPKTLVKKVIKQPREDVWLDKGILIPTENDYYQTKIKLTNGVLKANGNELPINTTAY